MEYVKHQEQGNYEVAIKGKITFSDHMDFKNIIHAVNDNSCQKVTLNLENVEFIDSAALGMMLLLRDETEKNGKGLLLKTPKGQVKKMFQVSRFYDLFDIEE